MARTTRAETREINRAKVIAAAREEFAASGYRAAKIDVIAARAGLTRGAVYSNFPGKRALYFAVLAATAGIEPERAAEATRVTDAVAAFARAWVARLPLTAAEPLRRDLISQIEADEVTRIGYAKLTGLQAVLLGLALENLEPDAGRRVRTAAATLTTLHGASRLAGCAPGFVDPFNVIASCELLTGLTVDDRRDEPPATMDPPVRAVDGTVPTLTGDLFGIEAADSADTVVFLGLHRLDAVEAAVRGGPVTVVAVAGDPAELMPLVRLTMREFVACLRGAVPARAWPRLRLVCDDTGELARQAGVTPGDDTEVALRVQDGLAWQRAEGFGACDAIARQTRSRPRDS